MSLIATTAAGVETAFAVAAEFVIVGSYRKRDGNPDFDPITEQMSDDGNLINNVRFLQVAATREEREASPVSVGDAKFLVPGVDLPGLSPGENDVIELPGAKYNVLVSKFVPGLVLHIIFGRKA